MIYFVNKGVLLQGATEFFVDWLVKPQPLYGFFEINYFSSEFGQDWVQLRKNGNQWCMISRIVAVGGRAKTCLSSKFLEYFSFLSYLITEITAIKIYNSVLDLYCYNAEKTKSTSMVSKLLLKQIRKFFGFLSLNFYRYFIVFFAYISRKLKNEKTFKSAYVFWQKEEKRKVLQNS